MANVVSMKQLLEAGVHFGHPTRKWNPKMKKYIYTARNDIYIINLEKTVTLIDEAYAFIKDIALSGKSILFVGTKKQAQEAIAEAAQKCGMYYMKSRWLGGTLTNFTTIRSRIDRLNKLNQMEKMNEFNVLPKKEVIKLKAERDKLEENLGGIKDMRTLPGALFVVDPKKEHLAVAEARSLRIPIVGIVDTNCDRLYQSRQRRRHPRDQIDRRRYGRRGHRGARGRGRTCCPQADGSRCRGGKRGCRSRASCRATRSCRANRKRIS